MFDTLLEQEIFTLKGRLFTLTVLTLHGVDIDKIAGQCEYLLKKAPKLFEYAPIVISLAEITRVKVDFTSLNALLRRYRLIPVAVQDASAAQQIDAQAAGLAVIKASRRDDEGRDKLISGKTSSPNLKSVQPLVSSTKLIRSPVRSGQQIYAQGGDLIVLSSVSHGAELLADGNIHVYGALRGRALAGIKGCQTARIFCQQCRAELLSIAGQYIINETINQEERTGPKQVYLADGSLHIADL